MVTKLWMIEWLDSCSYTDRWQFIDNLNEEPIKCLSIGFIVKETKHIVIIAPHVSHVNNDAVKKQVSGCLCIPKVNIIKKTILRGVKL